MKPPLPPASIISNFPATTHLSRNKPTIRILLTRPVSSKTTSSFTGTPNITSPLGTKSLPSNILTLLVRLIKTHMESERRERFYFKGIPFLQSDTIPATTCPATIEFTLATADSVCFDFVVGGAAERF
jgi:hypothetical protein